MRWVAVAVLGAAFGCGRLDFDSVPTASGSGLAYAPSQAIFVFNDQDATKTHAIADLVPQTTGVVTSYAIDPDLSALTGLSFDPSTGVIAGRPSQTSPVTPYVVTATGDQGITTAQLTIRTGPGFYVDDLGDAADVGPTDKDCVTAAGTCTMRAAIAQLGAFDRTSRIVLVIPAGTIGLGGTELAPTTPMEIIGVARDATIIDANHASKVFNFGDDNAVTLTGMTVQNGTSATDGGCIYARGGAITLQDVAVLGCATTGASSSGGGAMITDDFGTRVVKLLVTDCVFSGNTASTTIGSGGGLYLAASPAGSSATISSSTFSNNAVGTGARGGGLAYWGGTLLLSGNVFVGNTGEGGALNFQTSTTVTLTNNTITHNIGVSSAGGIQTNNVSVMTLVNDTIADNTCDQGCFNGAGISQYSGGSMQLENTILSGNLDLQNAALANCNAAATSNGHNLTDSPSPCYSAAAGDVLGTDPALGPLQDNGGPTQTRAIAETSGAFNTASASCPSSDQRGPAFARPARGACDIGAFELQ